MEPEIAPEKSFVRGLLPWIIAGAALVLYLVTLNKWVNFSTLLPVAEISGWTWQPEVHAPLYWLVTYPFRWLPAKVIPVALNFFAALCAVLTLALLARSVALLPHDRTHDQRQREKSKNALLSIRNAWIPPVLATLICGLQLTFWEHATATSGGAFPQASGEMFDLLIFAYLVRSLLEFRIDQNETWLTRGALIYGAAITNSWAMIGFLPLFIVALVWIRGLDFFNVRFLMRIFVCGLVGLSLYLILPLVQSRADIAPIPFWRGLKYNVTGEQYTLIGVLRYFKNFKQDTLLLVLTSIIPIFLISIRWASYFGDTSKLGVGLTTLTFRLVHAMFLLICIWVLLDPPFSPRFNLLNKAFNVRFLSLTYLSALCAGYCSGYLLLLFSGRADRATPKLSGFSRFLNAAVTGGIWALLLLSPALLLYRNLPQIRTINGPLLEKYANSMLQSLPKGKVILLADPDASANISRRLLLLESKAVQSGRANDLIFLDTASLKWPDYHLFLKKKYGNQWPFIAPTNKIEAINDTNLMMLVAGLARTNQVCYLHPSFGYYFEILYPEPHGLVYRMRHYPRDSLTEPVLSKAVLAENESFWAKEDSQTLKPIVAAVTPPRKNKDPDVLESVVQALRLKEEPDRDMSLLASMYSRALCYWGVELQKQGELQQAAAQFKRAQDLNPDNIVAKVNLECNQNLQAGRKPFVTISKEVTDEFGKYRSWDAVMGENGPFDEPKFCYEEGRLYLKNNLYRQAANQLDRTINLAPENLPAHLLLAQLYVLCQYPDQALKIVDDIHARAATFSMARTNSAELLAVEASAHLAKNDLPTAEATVEKVLAKFPGDEDILGTASQVYLNYGRYSNAIAIIEKELKLYPDNVNALTTKGFAYLQLGAFQDAIPPLTKVLQIETNATEVHYSALLNRAIAYLRSDKLEEALRDYELLAKAFPTAFRVYYGLGDISYRKHDTNSAIRNYQLYLANSPTNTDESRFVIARLKELKAHTP